MRFLLLIFIISIVWSGYSTAANAFMMIQSQETAKVMIDMSDCASMNQMGAKKADHQKSIVCQIKCHLCCFPSLGLSPLASVVFKVRALAQPLFLEIPLPKDIIFSLFEPPKILA